MTPKIKPWLFLAMIFVAGILTGVALTVALGSHFRSEPGAQQMKSRWMMYLTRQLNLSADQQAKIDPILTSSEAEIQAVRKDNADRFSQIFQKTNAQIAAILTPEQKAQLDKMSKDMERNRDRMFPGGHLHPHGPDGMGMSPPPGPPPNH